MSLLLAVRNRQRVRPVKVPFLRRIARTLVQSLLEMENVDLGICLVAAPEMTRLNDTFLHHQGCTDVITFNYTEKAEQASGPSSVRATRGVSEDRRDACPALLHGEIFICLDVALAEARRFRTTWQSEVTRYLIHGLLHLQGYDDRSPAGRRKMKRKEHLLLCHLRRRFELDELGGVSADHRD